MFDMSIQEVNGKGPKKRKKSLERICDNEGRECSRSELNAGDDGAATAPGAGEAPKSGVQLLHWRDMPQHLQFNPYVLTGYRPLQSWAGCVGSLFYFHNETINILTHGKLNCRYLYHCYHINSCSSLLSIIPVIRNDLTSQVRTYLFHAILSRTMLYQVLS